jgi:hypothetical protein
MNLTLSVDEDAVERARKVAQQQGTSLNDLVRRFIASLAGQISAADRAEEIVKLFEKEPGNSRGRKIRREDAYEGRT